MRNMCHGLFSRSSPFLLPGLPKGVLNIVHGTHDTVNRILDHPDIASISFVGSGAGTEAGVQLFSEHAHGPAGIIMLLRMRRSRYPAVCSFDASTTNGMLWCGCLPPSLGRRGRAVHLRAGLRQRQACAGL